MIKMEDIIREGHPTLRATAKEVSIPLSDEDIQLGQEMMEFLVNSQDPIKAEELDLWEINYKGIESTGFSSYTKK